MNDRNQEPCPRCDAPALRSWDELEEAERELVLRLPASADYSVDRRVARHRWCTRCWHEATGDAAHDA